MVFFKKLVQKFWKKKIPAQFRSDYWFGITKRARIIFYNPKKISSEDLVNLSYEDLTDKGLINLLQLDSQIMSTTSL